jgi:hypothetical protein
MIEDIDDGEISLIEKRTVNVDAGIPVIASNLAAAVDPVGDSRGAVWDIDGDEGSDVRDIMYVLSYLWSVATALFGGRIR